MKLLYREMYNGSKTQKTVQLVQKPIGTLKDQATFQDVISCLFSLVIKKSQMLFHPFLLYTKVGILPFPQNNFSFFPSYRCSFSHPPLNKKIIYTTVFIPRSKHDKILLVWSYIIYYHDQLPVTHVKHQWPLLVPSMTVTYSFNC